MNLIIWLILIFVLLFLYSLLPLAEKALVGIEGLYEAWQMDETQEAPRWFSYWNTRNSEIWLTLKTARLVFLFFISLIFYLAFSADGLIGGILQWMIGILLIGTLIFVEFISRGIQVNKARTFLPFCVRYIFLISYMMYPIHYFLRKTVKTFFKIMNLGGFHINPWSEDASFEQLRVMEAGPRKKSIERSLIYKVFELGEKWVRDIMLPRSKMQILPFQMSIREILKETQNKGFSRFPVVKENTDEIIGVLNLKDIFKILDEHDLDEKIDLNKWVRSPFFIPETKRIRELMLELQYNKRHMALVVDEYGALVGMVTRDDLYQDFLGDFHGVSGEEEDLIQYVEPHILIVKSEIVLDDLEEQLDLVFPEKRDYATLAGFLLSQLGSMPNIGDEISFGGWIFQVVDADEKTIRQVRISRSNS